MECDMGWKQARKQASKRRDHEQALVAIWPMALVVGWGRVGITGLM